MTTNELTKRQQTVFDFVEDYIGQNGFPPSLAEIALGIEIQPNAVRKHLLLLQKKKVLRYIPKISRGIELLTQKTSGIPIYGTVPAGHPFLSQENIVGNFEVRNYISASKGVFGLHVRGDSMKDAKLFTGDLVFVDPKKSPRNGTIVIALVEGEPTMKRYYKEGNSIVLKPDNKKYKPITILKSDERFRIVGVVVGAIRTIDAPNKLSKVS